MKVIVIGQPGIEIPSEVSKIMLLNGNNIAVPFEETKVDNHQDDSHPLIDNLLLEASKRMNLEYVPEPELSGPEKRRIRRRNNRKSKKP